MGENASDYYTSEVDWGEDPNLSWDGGATYDYKDNAGGEEFETRPSYHTRTTVQKPESWTYFEDDSESDDFDDDLLFFSGRSRDPNTFHQWEQNMEDWFRYYKIPEDDKMTHALNTLTGEAYIWWIKEEKCRIYLREPEWLWNDLKDFMYDEFVTGDLSPRECPKGVRIKIPLRRRTKDNLNPYRLYNKKNAAVQNRTPPQPSEPRGQPLWAKKKQQTQRLDPLLKLHATTSQCKSTVLKDISKIACCRYTGKDPLGKDCQRKKATSSHRVYIQEAPKKERETCSHSKLKSQESPHLLGSIQASYSNQVDSELNSSYQITTVMHLSQGQNMEISLGSKAEMDQHASSVLRSNKEIETVSTPKDDMYQANLIPYAINNSMILLGHLSCAKSVDTGTSIKEKSWEQKHSVKTKAVKERESEGLKLKPIIQESWGGIKATVLIKEEPPDAPIPQQTRGKSLDFGPNQKSNLTSMCAGMFKSIVHESWRGVIASMLIKEEPPDAHLKQNTPCKFLDSRSTRISNLPSLYADSPILRTKFFQGGGYDADITSKARPESHQPNSLVYIGPEEDQNALQEAPKPSHEESSLKTTWSDTLNHQASEKKSIPLQADSQLITNEFTKQWTTCSTYRELSLIGNLQTYIWHPGATNTSTMQNKRLFHSLRAEVISILIYNVLAGETSLTTLPSELCVKLSFSVLFPYLDILDFLLFLFQYFASCCFYF